MLTETIYIQGEALTLDGDQSAAPNLIRTRTQNQERTSPTANEIETGQFDTFGLRPDYTGDGDEDGWGYLDINGTDTGAQASTTFDAPAGTYEITLRVANGGTGAAADRPISVIVDGGVEAEIASTNTGQFYHWELRTVTVTLDTDGTHTLVISQTTGNQAPNIDAIAIHNVGETPNFSAPTFTSPATFTIAEKTTEVGTVTATDIANDTSADAPARPPMTYALSGGADQSAFTIDPDTGALSLKEAADFETKTSYDVTVSATDAEGGVTSQAITVEVTDEPETPAIGSATVTVTPNGGLNASTFSAGTMVVANTGDKAISTVTINLSDALFTNANSAMVFDPAGLAGDATAKDFSEDGGSGSYSVTPQLSGGSDADGYTTLTLSFDSLDPGETLAFSIDIDPTSIQGAPGSGDAGSVSGLELTGSTVTVEYADASTATTTLFADGSDGGAVATVSDAEPVAPMLSVGGQGGDVAVGEGTQTVAVTGPANANVTVVIAVGGLGNGVTAQTLFDTNTATGVSYETVTLDGNGEGSFSVSVIEGQPLYMAAAVQGDGAGEFGAVSAPLAVALAPPPDPFETVIIQAEDGTPGDSNSTGTVVRDADNPETGGFTGLRPDFGGTGYIDYGSAAGDSYTYTFNDSEGGARVLHVRYASNGDRPLDVRVNGTSVVADPVNATPFTDTDPDGNGGAEGFDTWAVASFDITTLAGDNTVTLEIPAPGANAPNVDAIAISAVGETVDFPVADISADADGDLAAAPLTYTVGLSEADSVDFTLSGVDEDVTGLEVSTDGGTTFAPASLGAVTGGVAQVTVDLSAITDTGPSDVVFRVTDGAANTATTSVPLDFVEESVVAEIQAETFAITDTDGDTAPASNQPGFTGTGFMDMGLDAGDAVSFDVTVTEAGTYTLLFRYASSTDRPMTLEVDGSGSPVTLPFLGTGDFETWDGQAIEVDLVSGSNTITLANVNATGPNIDRVTILRDVPVTDTPPTAEDGAGAGLEDDASIVVDIADLIADAEDDPAEPTITAAEVDPASGTVSVAGTELTFTPAPDFNGDAVIAYTVEDSAGQQASGSVTVAVSAVNDAPEISGTLDGVTVTDEAGTTVDLSGLVATDVDNAAAEITLGVRAAGGGAAPAGVTVTGTTLIIPAGLSLGSLELEIFASDGALDSGSGVPLTVTVEDAPATAITLTFDAATITSYTANQDGSGNVIIGDAGASMQLDGNLWKRVPIGQDYVITDDTRLEVTVEVGAIEPEILAVGFDLDEAFSDGDGNIYQMAGTQRYAPFNDVSATGTDNGDGTTTFVIDLSAHAGTTISSLVFIGDDDVSGDGVSSPTFSGVALFESDEDPGNTPPREVGGGVADFTVDEGGRIEVDLPFVDDDGDPLTYSFSVVDSEGAPVTVEGLSLEGGVLSGPAPTDPGTYAFTLTATDPDGAAAQSAFVLTVNDTNDPPVSSAPALEPFLLEAGDQIDGIDLAQFAIYFSDPDAGDVLTLSAEGLPPGLTVDGEGVIVGTPTAGGTYEVTIRATDLAGASATLTIDLQIEGGEVGDVVTVEAEDFTGLAEAAEFYQTGQSGASGNQIIRVASAGDQGSISTVLSQNGLVEGWYIATMTRYDETDGSALFSLQIGDTVLADNAPFDGVPDGQTANDTFDNTDARGNAGQSGNLKTIVFETPVFVTSGTILTLSGTADGELLRTDKFTFTRISAPDDPPSAPTIDNAAIVENGVGAVVGTLSATDPDGDDAAIGFSVDPASQFEVIGNQLKLKEGISLDHEAAQTVDVDVTATDETGAQTTATLTITVGDVDEPPSAPVLSNATVDENADGAVIGTVSALDPEDTAVSFTVGDSRFEVDGDDQLTLRTGESLDHEAGETVSVDVTATDETGQSVTETLNITVNDVNEAPSLAAGASIDPVSVANGVGAAIDLSALGATDEDAGDDPTYVIVSATGTPLPAGFEVVGTQLIVPADAPTGTYEIEVFATDGELDSESVLLTVAVGAPAPFAPIVIQAEAEANSIVLAQAPDGQSTQIRDADNQETNGNRPDFTGTGYVDFGNDAGDTLSIPVTITEAGQYDLNIRYATNTDRPLDLVVNGGAPQSLPFPSTDPDGTGPEEGFDHWEFETVTVTLIAGTNTIDLSIPDGANVGPNLDRIEITAAGTGPIGTTDLTADEGDDLAATAPATVDPDNLGAVDVTLTGVDADITLFEVAYDGVTFTEVVPAGDVVTLDLSAFAAAASVTATFRVTDDNGNTATTEAIIGIEGGISVDPITIQAEDATLDDVGESDTGVIAVVTPTNPDEFGTYRAGAVGDAYADFGTDPGESITFSVDAPVAGTYSVAFRYANGDGAQADRPLDLVVNGGPAQSVSFPFTPGTEPWEAWSEVSVEIALAQGANTVALVLPEGGANGPNIDQAVFTYTDDADDTTADEGGDLSVAADATVDPDDLNAVIFALSGVDADIVTYEYSTDGGATFTEATPSSGEVTLDLSAFAAETAVEVLFRVTDDAGNVATTGATIAIEEAPEAFSQTIQLEARDGSVTIIDDTGGGTGNQNQTQPRDSQNPEAVSPERGPDGLWDGFNGAGYLDMGMNVGDAFSFEIDSPAAGTYTFAFRYGNGGTTDRPMTLSVGGTVVATLAFAPGSAWDDWQVATVDVALAQGVNTITVTNTIATGPNFDQVTVTNNVEPEEPDAEPGPRDTILINFQDGTAPKASGYLVGNFEDFGDQGNGFTYGFITEASATDADGTSNTPTGSGFPAIAINERTGTGTLPDDGSLPADRLSVNFDSYDPRLTGYAHFDLGSFPSRTGWELALEDGWYEVTVSVGDTGGPNDSDNLLFVEGALAADWTPTAAFKTELVTVLANVQDGHLTLSAQGGTITEMQYIEVRALPDLTPGDAREAPEDYAAFTQARAVSSTGEVPLGVDDGALPVGIDPTADIVLGIDVVDGRGGALLESLSDGSIRLYETLSGAEVAYNANTTGGFDSLTIAPATDLKEFTSYTIVIDGFQDRGDNDDATAPTREFQKFSTTFVTGEAPEVEAREVAFVDNVELASNPAIGESFTSIEISPDQQHLYVTSLSGTITRWELNADGSLDQSTKEVFAPGGDFNEGGGRRGIIGIAFDPEDPQTIWITDNYPVPLNGRSNSVPDFSGRVSKVTLGANNSLENASIETYLSGLPRSNGDHVTNSIEFRPNPDAGQAGEPDFLLYLTQGSNSAMGAPDSAWGFRPERLLNAAILEIDHTRDAPAGGFDVSTEPLPTDGQNRRFADSDGDLKNGGISITSGPYSGNFLHFTEQGVAEVREGADAGSALVAAFYDPFEADAVLRIFAEGNRNAYDLVWHTNGFLYVPTNGSAAGGNVPDDPDTAQDEGVNSVGLQNDYLFRMVEGGYYGHPNPLRDKFVLNGGNPTSGADPNQVTSYPAGIDPDPDYDLEGSYSLANNKSPNGVIQYFSNAFGTSLQNAVIFTQYSSGDNLRAVLLNQDGTVAEDFILRDTDGNIISYVDPLDVIEGGDGRLYMLTLNRSNGVSQIIRLDAAPGGAVADNTADVGNDLALIVVDGTDPAASLFQINGLDPDIEAIEISFNGGQAQPVSLDAQNRFTVDLSGQTGEVTALLTVVDGDGNTASESTSFTPGATTSQNFYDGTDFTNLDPGSTIIRVLSDPSTHEGPASGNDGDGDGLNDGHDGDSYVDFGGGAGDKVSLNVTVAVAGIYDVVLRMANGSADPRPIDIKLGGQTVSLTNTNTGSFTTWQDFSVQLTLEAGVNTIVFEQVAAAGGPNIDSVTVTLDTPTGVPNDGTETVGGVTFVKYEAENADLSGGPDEVTVAEDDRGQSGGSFIDFDGTADQTIEWTVFVAEDGTYQLDIVYALAVGKEARPMALSVDGTAVGTLDFSPNSNAAETLWGPQTTSLILTAGAHTIAVTAPAANGPNVDYLRITQEPVDTFDPTYAAIDGEGRIELEASDGSTRTVSETTVEFYFIVDEDDTYALDLAANPGAPDGAGLSLFLTAGDGLPVQVDEDGFPGSGEAGETTAYVQLQAGVEYKLTVVSDQPGASALDYLDVRPAPGDEDADIEIQSFDPTYYDNRLHFSWIDNPTAVVSNNPRNFKESGTVQISNSGTATLEVLEATLAGPFELATPGIFDGLTLAAGESIAVEVLFDRDAYTSGGDGVTGVFQGSLSLRTNDADSPLATVDLAGFWQARDEGGQEPNINEVWQVFGFGNFIEGLSLNNGGENDELDFYDVYLPVDATEVLSPYWRLADGVAEATITQIAAFHSPSGATLGIHAPGNKNADLIFSNHANTSNQMLLPLLGNGNFATATFDNGDIPDGWDGNDLFGIEVANLSTDPTLNPTGSGAPSQAELTSRYPGYTVDGSGQVFDPDGNPVPDGYTVRMFQAVDDEGEVIDNVVLGVMDYTGINYDYNDNMFVIEGVTPVGFGGVATISGLDDSAADNRLVFSRLDNTENGNQAFRDTATFTITNDGIGSLTVDGIVVTGAFQVVSGPTPGQTLASGASVEVTVQFTGTDPSNNGASVLYEGDLTVSTSVGAQTVALAGLAQLESQGGEEPTVAQIVQAFGYSTDVAQGQLANGGTVEQVGDEVLLPYLQRLDSSQPIEVIQIAAYLSPGIGRLNIHDVTDGTLTELYAQDDNQFQTVLPDALIAGPGAEDGAARATIDRDEPFGLKVTVDGLPTFSAWTDPNANLADDTFNLPAGNEGHYIRFFQAKDAAGNDIPGRVIGIQDYPGGENFDYNDHMFVIKNVEVYELSPAEDANGDGVNDTLVLDDDNDGTPNFFDDDFTPPMGPQTAFNATQTPWEVGADGLTLEARFFDNGGQGVAYNDGTATHQGDGFRSDEAVDISFNTLAIGYTQAGEWLEYTINVPVAGEYELSFNSSSPANGRALTASFSQNGVAYETTTASVPNTGAYTTYVDTAPQSVTLNAGEQVLRVNFDLDQQDLASFRLVPTEVQNTPPTTTGITGAPQGEEDTPYSFDVAGFFDDAEDDALEFAASGLPTGLTISTAGVISGTPTQDGAFEVTVTAEDDDGATIASVFTLTVSAEPVVTGQAPYPGPDAPTFAAGVLTVDASNYDDGGQGVAYNDAAGLQGGSTNGRPGSDVEQTAGGDIGWIAAGEWLEYTVDVPAAGAYDLELLLSTNGGSGRSATVDFYLPTASTPYATSGSIPNPDTGSWTNFQPRSAEGLTLQAGTQVVRVTFEGGSQDFQSFTLIQQEVDENQAPTAGALADAVANEGSEVSLDVSGSFSDPETDPLTFTALGLPAGLLISASGLITGTAPEVGADTDYPVTVTGTDPGGLSASASFTLTIEDVPPVGTGQTPFPGPDAPVLDGSLTVAAANFDTGGQNVSWNDNPGRDGSHPQRTDTDVELVGATADIGYVLPGEWVEYTIDVAEAGTYQLSLNAKTPIGGNSIAVSIEDGAPIAAFALPDSNGASNGFGGTAFGETAAIEVDLQAGVQTLRFTFDGAPASNGFILDFRSFTLNEVADPVEPEVGAIGEAGSVTFSQSNSSEWFSVTFGEALDDPAVVMGPISYNGNQPATMRVRNVTDTGFEFQLDEWDYLNGGHIEETVGWLAIEAGAHTLANGQVVQAGTTPVGNGAASIDFGSAFGSAPVVLAQVASDNDPDAVTDRIDNVTSTGFDVALDNEESNSGTHGSEALSWIAVSTGGSASEGSLAGKTGDVVTHQQTSIDFGSPFGNAFVFLADMQTEDGNDPATVRLNSLTDAEAIIFLEEEASADSETNHTTEDVGWYALDAGSILGDDLLS